MEASDKCNSEASPTLYYDLECPQSLSCFMLTKIIDMQVTLRKIKQGHVTNEFRQINPSGILPTLVDNEIILSDSHTILLYLCDKYAAAHVQNLSPTEHLPRLHVLSMLFYEGGVLYPNYCNYLAASECENISAVDQTKHRSKVLESYNHLDSILSTQLCLAGNDLTVADLSIMTTLSALNGMLPISKDQWPKLHKWFKAVLKNKDWYIYNAEEILNLSRQYKEFPQISEPIQSALQLNAQTKNMDANSQLRWNDKITLKQKFFRIFSKDRISTLDIIQESDRPSQGALATGKTQTGDECCTTYSNSDSMIQSGGQIDTTSGTSSRMKKLSFNSANRKKYLSHTPRIRRNTFEVISSQADLELKSLPGITKIGKRAETETLTKVEKLYVKTEDKQAEIEDHPEIRPDGDVDLRASKSLTILTKSIIDEQFVDRVCDKCKSAEC